MVLSFLSDLRMSHNCYLEVRSMPLEGSSKSTSLLSAMHAMATESLRLVPPDRFCDRAYLYSRRFMLSSHFSTSASLL